MINVSFLKLPPTLSNVFNSFASILKSLAAPQFLSDPVFTETLAEAQRMKQSSTKDFVDLFAEAFENNNPGGQLAQFFMTPETRGDIDFNTTNADALILVNHF